MKSESTLATAGTIGFLLGILVFFVLPRLARQEQHAKPPVPAVQQHSPTVQPTVQPAVEPQTLRIWPDQDPDEVDVDQFVDQILRDPRYSARSKARALGLDINDLCLLGGTDYDREPASETPYEQFIYDFFYGFGAGLKFSQGLDPDLPQYQREQIVQQWVVDNPRPSRWVK